MSSSNPLERRIVINSEGIYLYLIERNKSRNYKQESQNIEKSISRICIRQSNYGVIK